MPHSTISEGDDTPKQRVGCMCIRRLSVRGREKADFGDGVRARFSVFRTARRLFLLNLSESG